jgi:hypothetical protein
MKQISTLKMSTVIVDFIERSLCLLLLFVTMPSALLHSQSNGNGQQVIPELVFQNPVLVSGTDKLEGATYRFSDVATGVDALLEISKISDNLTVINNLDVTQYGWNKAFQPELGRNGNAGTNQNWWVLFHMTFVKSGTNNKMNLAKFYVTALDVDGDNVSVQEYVQMQKADSIKFSPVSYLALNAPINCGLSNNPYDKLTQGPVQNFNNIDTAATAVMATYTYINQSDFDFVLGAKSGATNSNAGLRMNSLWFKSFNLVSPAQSTLPLRLLNFQGNVNDNKASLQWSVTENETGNSFELEKSGNGKDFNSAALIFTTTKTGTEYYSFKEPIAKTTFYRLKMVNKDNSASYSKIIRLSVKDEASDNAIRILQNPVGSSLQFSYNVSSNENTTLNIYTSTGTQVFSAQIQSEKGTNTYLLNLDSKINKGFYILEVSNGNERSISKFIKQ